MLELRLLKTFQQTNSFGHLNRYISSVRFCRFSTESDHKKIDLVGEDLFSHSSRRYVPKTKAEFDAQTQLEVEQPKNACVNRVAIIGLPNAGKSTLVNQLVGVRITSTSCKVHTTRRNILGVISEGSTQIEILDTPGIVDEKKVKRHSLEPRFLSEPQESVKQADIVALIADIGDRRFRSSVDVKLHRILMQYRHKKSILILNKIDQLQKKRDLLDIVSKYTGNYMDGRKNPFVSHTRFQTRSTDSEVHDFLDQYQKSLSISESQFDFTKSDRRKLFWPYFSKVFMISAIDGDGVDDLKDYFIETAYPDKWKYHRSLVTKQQPTFVILDTIREQLYEHLIAEIPYKLKLKIELFELDELGNICLVVDILCKKNSEISAVLGPNGSNVSRIVAESRIQLSKTFQCDVSLKIIVKSMIGL